MLDNKSKCCMVFSSCQNKLTERKKTMKRFLDMLLMILIPMGVGLFWDDVVPYLVCWYFVGILVLVLLRFIVPVCAFVQTCPPWVSIAINIVCMLFIFVGFAYGLKLHGIENELLKDVCITLGVIGAFGVFFKSTVLQIGSENKKKGKQK